MTARSRNCAAGRPRDEPGGCSPQCEDLDPESFAEALKEMYPDPAQKEFAKPLVLEGPVRWQQRKVRACAWWDDDGMVSYCPLRNNEMGSCQWDDLPDALLDNPAPPTCPLRRGPVVVSLAEEAC